MRQRAIKLQYHTRRDRFGDRVTVAEAIDAETREVVASFSLEMMAAWLRKHRYEWCAGSNGLWLQAA